MFSKIPYPAIATNIGINVKANRCFNLSDRKAMAMEKPNAAAHGGIEYSCVLIARQQAGQVSVCFDV